MKDVGTQDSGRTDHQRAPVMSHRDGPLLADGLHQPDEIARPVENVIVFD
jgi:hypothetical protein